ncbi:hypothetical protein QFC24_000006 [Naganishia onofrii]|uniref:Uncharacterized protein n=1 Tax=Naganishia onofrii TaxID=1851511 RepID=A0ACC2XV15_9TREE|nr:hypothetical protein QFC24_000006 [Naganishia onofrii]
MESPNDNKDKPDTVEEQILAAPPNPVNRGDAEKDGAAVDPQKDLENRRKEFGRKEQAARGRNNEGPNAHGIDHNRGGA